MTATATGRLVPLAGLREILAEVMAGRDYMAREPSLRPGERATRPLPPGDGLRLSDFLDAISGLPDPCAGCSATAVTRFLLAEFDALWEERWPSEEEAVPGRLPERHCAGCGRRYSPQQERSSYCSQACRQRAYRQRKAARRGARERDSARRIAPGAAPHGARGPPGVRPGACGIWTRRPVRRRVSVYAYRRAGYPYYACRVPRPGTGDGRTVVIPVRVSEQTAAAIDRARGQLTRSAWLRGLISAALGEGTPDPAPERPAARPVLPARQRSAAPAEPLIRGCSAGVRPGSMGSVTELRAEVIAALEAVGYRNREHHLPAHASGGTFSAAGTGRTGISVTAEWQDADEAGLAALRSGIAAALRAAGFAVREHGSRLYIPTRQAGSGT